MHEARSLLVSMLFATGLAACGQNAATAETETGNSADIAGVKANMATSSQATTSFVSEPVPAKAHAARVTELPLSRGYYVASDTPCGEASNATVMLLRREGIGGARDFCAFEKIEQTGPNTYRVTEACGDLQDSAPAEVSVTIYTLKGDTAFTSKSEHGWERSARYCAQPKMPPDWRANDISDVTG